MNSMQGDASPSMPASKPDVGDWANPDETRTMFSQALSKMYANEVPLYGDLLKLVRDVNERTLARDARLRSQLENRHELGTCSSAT